MLTYFLILSSGVFAGFVLCGLLAVNREGISTADTNRLDFLEDADVTTTVVQGYFAIFPVGVETPLAMGADLRETIDAARAKWVEEAAQEVIRSAAGEKVNG